MSFLGAVSNTTVVHSTYTKEESIYDTIYRYIKTHLRSQLKQKNFTYDATNNSTKQFTEKLYSMLKSKFTSTDIFTSNATVIDRVIKKYENPNLLTKIENRYFKNNRVYVSNLVGTVIKILNDFKSRVLPKLEKQYEERVEQKKRMKAQNANKTGQQKRTQTLKKMKKTWNKRVNAHLRSIDKKKKKKKNRNKSNNKYHLVK